MLNKIVYEWVRVYSHSIYILKVYIGHNTIIKPGKVTNVFSIYHPKSGVDFTGVTGEQDLVLGIEMSF